MSDDSIFEEALQAIGDGDYERGRDLLSSLLKVDKTNPEYWLWMSTVVPTHKERVYCLRNVLKLDPENEAAERGLLLFGEETLDKPPKPAPHVPRDWISELEKSQKIKSIDKPGFFARPIGRFVSFLAVIVFISVVAVYSISQDRGWRIFGPKLTITPIPWTVTPSVTPTPTPKYKTPTPTLEGPIPLEMLLDATHTPTPLYVNTPHPRIEAFSVAFKAYDREDYASMTTFMQQATNQDPESVDILYYLGEAYRLAGDNEQAIEIYEKAISLDNQFAPSFLGFARAKYARFKEAKLSNELETAISLDPELTVAYLELAEYWNRVDQPGKALSVLKSGKEILNHIPDYHIIRAETLLLLDENDDALDSAKQGLELDITKLQAYLTLSKAYRANEDYGNAFEMIVTYLDYDEGSLEGRLVLGSILYLIGDEYKLAEKYLTDVIEASEEEIFSAYFYRGITYIELGEYQPAVNDLVIAKELEPKIYNGNFYLGKALYFTERYNEAFEFVNVSENLSGSDIQTAQVYYWRALIHEKLRRTARAEDDWERLLELPDDVYPEEWRLTAMGRLGIPTEIPTETPEVQETITPTGLDSPSVTETFAATQPEE